MKYRHKPIIVEAVHLKEVMHFDHPDWFLDLGINCDQVTRKIKFYGPANRLIVTAYVGDWLVNRMNGDFDVMSNELFLACYEEVPNLNFTVDGKEVDGKKMLAILGGRVEVPTVEEQCRIYETAARTFAERVDELEWDLNELLKLVRNKAPELYVQFCVIRNEK
jgi:hypothetical protein